MKTKPSQNELFSISEVSNQFSCKSLNLKKIKITNLSAIHGGGDGGDERSGLPWCPPKETE